MSSNKPGITWLQILSMIKAKSGDDVKNKAVPAVNKGRSILGTLLVSAGKKLQPKQ